MVIFVVSNHNIFFMKNQFIKSNLLNIIGFNLLLMFGSAQTSKAQESVVTFDIGSCAITLLSEGQRQGNASILIGATEEMMKQSIPDGTYPSATNVFLVEMADKNVLIDAGLGPKTLENLELCGKKASDIDAIFITHFHGDHTGSLVLNNERSFTKAALYVSKPEYEYYMNDELMNNTPENRRSAFSIARQIFEAYKDKLTVFIPSEIEIAQELIPGIRGVAAYGHTPGHVGYLLESDGQKLFFWGDLTHAMAIQMPYPEVAVTYDSDPILAVESRQKLLKYLSDNNLRIAGAHIQFPGIGLVKKNNTNGYTFNLTCLCEGR